LQPSFDTEADADHDTVYLLRVTVHAGVKTMKAIVLAAVSEEEKIFKRIGMAHLKGLTFFDGCKGEIIKII
jgi:hypothetical protein